MKWKNILTIALAACVIFGFSAAGFLKAPEAYSMAERRSLAQKPELSSQQLLSGKYMTQFEDFSLDQFPLRDGMRTLKAAAARYVFLQKDNHGIYEQDGYWSKLEYPMNSGKVERSGDKLREVYETYLAGTDCSVYLSVIPDKNCFLAPLGGYPVMDYSLLVENLREKLDFAEYIDIFGELSLQSFYRTDQHWRQETLSGVARTLADAMGAEISLDFTVQELPVPFYGAYCGQAALKIQPDTLYYLTGDLLDECIVTSYNTGLPTASHMYDMEKAYGKDPYEMFLSGSDALLTIENPNAATDKELVVFRDSFGSSLAPLLASGYAKITLVDLRYLQSGLLGNFIDFETQDVLFLYSTLVLNNTVSM